MPNDQLSWENLFKSDKKQPASSESKKPADTSEKSETSFAQMDWAPLDLTPLTGQKPAAKETVRVEVKTTTKIAQEKPMPAPAPAKVAPSSSVASNSAQEEDIDFPEPPKDEPQVLSVYELNRSIRSLLEGQFPLIWVKGEISNFKAHTSGHWYFSLKDAKAQISGVMFRGHNNGIKFRPEDGMEVLVRGRVTVYEPRGNYQIFCETMEPVGAGALQKAFEQLKAKLQAEGLFDQARKRPLPALPQHIAIVTSPTGAAIRDMLNVLGRRYKGARITLIPCKVQGEQAAGEIVAALELANRLNDVDVMIVGRGGGSIEDMWCFNDERVARAIAAARVPVISAVGHEIDFTIADFVADLRAPTPSAAAELVVKNAADLKTRIDNMQRSLQLAQVRKIQILRQGAVSASRRLAVVDPQKRIQDSMQRSDELSQRLEALVNRRINDGRMRTALLEKKLGDPNQRIKIESEKLSSLGQRLQTGWVTFHERLRFDIEKQMALLDSLSPLRVVERGYSLVTLDGKVVNSVAQVKSGDAVCIQFAHGRASAQIDKIESNKGVMDNGEGT